MFDSEGYIRMTFADFCTLPMQRHLIWQDSQLVEELREQGVDALAAGYCEWVSAIGEPKVSLGWAWFLASTASAVMLAPGGISCNVMLCAESGHALGVQQTSALLLDWLSSQRWQRDIVTVH